MCTQQEAVDREVLSLWASDIRQPLCSQAGPFQGMGHHQVVEKWGVLLPDLVLFIDDPLLHSFIIGFKYEEDKIKTTPLYHTADLL